MKDLVALASELQSFLEMQNWGFCFIGGLAVQHWGEPRLTRDLDLTVLTGFGGEVVYIDTLLSAYSPRIEGAREFALQNRVLLLKSKEGIGLDISLGALPFEEKCVSRAQNIEMLPNVRIRLCSAEDLIILKAFASRDRDWGDVWGILVRQGTEKLDWKYILEELQVLADLKEEPEIIARLSKLRHSQF